MSKQYSFIKKNYIIFLTAIIILLSDQLTKFLIRKNFQLNQSIALITNFLHLTYVTNTGSAFGLFKNNNIIFIIISLIVIIAILASIKRIKENQKLLKFCAGLLLGGTVGNLIDRLFYGYVTDFIDFRVWPFFNVADSAITVGIILLIILLWEK